MNSQLLKLVAFALVALFMHAIPRPILAQPANGTDQEEKHEFGNWKNQLQILQICSQIIEESDIIKELELVDDQRHAIASVVEEFRSYIKELGIEKKKRMLLLTKSDLSDEKRENLTARLQAELDDQIKTNAVKIFTKLKEHLLPHQLQRLQQIA